MFNAKKSVFRQFRGNGYISVISSLLVKNPRLCAKHILSAVEVVLVEPINDARQMLRLAVLFTVYCPKPCQCVSAGTCVFFICHVSLSGLV